MKNGLLNGGWIPVTHRHITIHVTVDGHLIAVKERGGLLIDKG